MEGRKRERKRSDVEDGSERGDGAKERETPKGSASVLVSEVEGGSGSRLGRLRSTAPH